VEKDGSVFERFLKNKKLNFFKYDIVLVNERNRRFQNSILLEEESYDKKNHE
tara:strand:- start:4067 stop:4222 length:156 start_codon:yes stop_codon:yes gene_type:complete